MGVIINIRGTNGSGKTTAVRTLMQHLGNKATRFSYPDKKGKDKPVGYRFNTSAGPLFVLGDYSGECGGIDRSFSYKGAAEDVMQVLEQLSESGSVIWEGVAAYSWKRYSAFAKAREAKGDRVIFALLDTPLDVCIKNTEARRAGRAALKGKEVKPLDPDNLIGKFEGWEANQKYIAGTGCECYSLPWQDPLPTLLGWLKIQ